MLNGHTVWLPTKEFYLYPNAALCLGQKNFPSVSTGESRHPQLARVLRLCDYCAPWTGQLWKSEKWRHAIKSCLLEVMWLFHTRTCWPEGYPEKSRPGISPRPRPPTYVADKQLGRHAGPNNWSRTCPYACCLPVDPVPLNALPCLASKEKGKVEWGETCMGGRLHWYWVAKKINNFFRKNKPILSASYHVCGSNSRYLTPPSGAIRATIPGGRLILFLSC